MKKLILRSNTIFFIPFFIAAVLNSSAQSWNHYPYQPAGSSLSFPADEGYHPGEPVEWWYTMGHVTGDSSGTNYSFMLTYFYYPQFGFDGFRIFNLSNDDTENFFSETLPVNYSILAQDHLQIEANVLSGVAESWLTASDTNGLIPFTYNISASQANGSINLNMVTIKRPLIIDTTGFFNLGSAGYTYYYSQTMLNIDGSLSLDGVSESVHGTAWIDRQWGQFNPNNGEKYEWFCVQLSNGMDFNIWNVFDTQNLIPQLPSYRLTSIYVNDSTDINTHDFLLDRKTFVYTPDSARVYSQQWNFVHDSIDLLITTHYPECEVVLPFRFYEGTTTVSGTVSGQAVTGVGFAELLHSYSIPIVNLLTPQSGQGWVGTSLIDWELTNPDSGRSIWYDVEYSTDNKQTFHSIAQGLTDTQVMWDGALLAVGTDCWIKVSAYSIDHTLQGAYVMDLPFVIGTVGVNSITNNESKIILYPNPITDGGITLRLEEYSYKAQSIKLQTIFGQQILQRELGKKDFEGGNLYLNFSGLIPGTYILTLEAEEGKKAVLKFTVQ